MADNRIHSNLPLQGNITTPFHTTRRQVLAGLAAIIAAQKAPAILSKNMIAARQIFLGRGGAKLPYDAEVEWIGVDETHGFANIVISGIEWDSFSISYMIPGPLTPSSSAYKTLFGGVYGYCACNRMDLENYIYLRQSASYCGIYEQIEMPTGRFVEFHSPSPTNLKWTIDGTDYPVAVCRPVSGSSFGVLYQAGNSSFGATRIPCRVASCQLYYQGTKVADLMPVRKDGVGCMFDEVSSSLVAPNEGTGAFIYGNDK